MRKVENGRDRLLDLRREAERSNRQGTYHRLVAVFDQIDRCTTGWRARPLQAAA
jgi:hypothetical protein